MSPWPDPAELLPAGLPPCSRGSDAQAGPTPYLGPGSTGQDRAAVLSSCQAPQQEEGQQAGRVLGPGRVPGLGWHPAAATTGAPRVPVCLCFGASLYLAQPKSWCHCLSCYSTTQHSQHGIARRQSGSWGTSGGSSAHTTQGRGEDTMLLPHDPSSPKRMAVGGITHAVIPSPVPPSPEVGLALTRLSVPSRRPGSGSSTDPRNAALLAGCRMGRLADLASRTACSTFSSSPGLAVGASGLSVSSGNFGAAKPPSRPPQHLSPAGSVPQSDTPQTAGTVACATGPGRCPLCPAQSPSSQRLAAALPCRTREPHSLCICPHIAPCPVPTRLTPVTSSSQLARSLPQCRR